MGKVIKRILLIVFALAIAAVAAFGIYIACVPRIKLDNELLDGIGTVTVCLDGAGNRIDGNVNGKNATFISVDDLDDTTLDAFVSTEDKRFYTHHGVDWRRLMSASFTNLFHGNYAQGASTITQQLAKNTHLSFDKKMSRKIQEIRLAKAIEKRYDKREILEKYLNVIYFGHNIYGIESAAQFYFDKSASDLAVEEAALLAAIINAPGRYSPISKPENALARRNLVLKNMYGNSRLGEADYLHAVSMPIELKNKESADSYYVSAARAEAAEILDKLNLRGNGYTIRTHLNPALQSALEAARDPAYRQKFVLCDRAGNVVAASGRFDAVGLRRQPGSAIKPLLSFAPAFERRILCPATPILDEAIDYGGYSPNNYGGDHLGWISARYALAHSNNIAAVKLMNACGIDYCYEFANRLGLGLDEGDKNFAAALGGLTYGTTLETLTAGYSTLAGGGLKATARYVDSIEKDGATVYTANTEQTRVMSEVTAHLVTDMMRTCAQTGTASKLAELPFQMAAKTGTVGSGQDGNTDAYCVGFTAEYALGVWYGAENGLLSNDVRGGTMPASTATKIWRGVYAHSSPSNFDYVFHRYRLDKLAYEHDHVLAEAPVFAAEKDVFYEIFPDFAKPLPVRLSLPRMIARLGDASVELRVNGDRYADYRLMKESDFCSEMIPLGKLGRNAETLFYDYEISSEQFYTYRLLALYPDGTSRLSDAITIMT